MNASTPRHAPRVRVFAAVLLASFVSLPTSAMQDPPLGKDVNEVKAIRVRNGSVEIVLHSSREFPVRSDVVVLRIGKQDFFKSHPPEDGSLHTLIFTISAEDFAALAPGLQMTVRYGKREPDPEDMPGVARVDRWDFGKLDKGIVGG